MMPAMDGFQTLARLKQDAGLRELPVIMISALDELRSVVRCIEMGAEDYLTKPFNRVLLRARIGASLEKKWLRDRERRKDRRTGADAAAAGTGAGTIGYTGVAGCFDRAGEQALGGGPPRFPRETRELLQQRSTST